MPKNPPKNLYLRCLTDWVGGVVARPALTLMLVAASVAVAAVYASQTFRMNSDNRQLVRQNAPFRVHYAQFLDRFPEFEETTLIVLKSHSIDLVDDAVDRLIAALEARPDLVRSIHAPGSDPFFEDHVFLYLDADELDDVIVRLAEAQPALATLARDPSLRALFAELELSLEHQSEPSLLPVGFERLALRLSELSDALLAGQPRRFAWADEFLGDGSDVYRLVSVQGRVDFDQAVSSGQLIAELRAIGQELGFGPESDISMRLTGFVPLGHDELVSTQDGIALAAGLSLLLLIGILGLGVRSLVIIVATFASLGSSLVWTTAYAMLAVGELNTISAAFAVLLIGLGVDFGIHLGLRYEEETRRGVPVPEALLAATRGVGGAVSLCAVTSAIGFLAFVPTAYRGLAALGIIAGGGMFLSLVATFTVMPAVLALLPAPRPRPRRPGTGSEHLYAFLSGHAGAVVGSTVLLTVTALAVSTQIQFDFSTLSMKDPASESMVTLQELLDEEILTDYSATVLAPDFASSPALASRLDALALVREVRAPSSYLPEDQPEKLEMIEDAALFLDPVFEERDALAPPSAEERLIAARSLRDRITAMTAADPDAPEMDAARRLAAALDRLLTSDDPAGNTLRLERLVLDELPERIAWLERALNVETVAFEDLPEDTRRRLVARDGSTQVVALPAEEVSDVEALERFVNAVTEVVPTATGRPVVEAGIGAIVVESFRFAIAIAFVCVVLVLSFSLRSVPDALFVLTPIALAALYTIAAGVLSGTPFNMANVVAIPLVLGLGIDNGIHIFMRFRHDGSLERAMASSTPRAVMLSAFTTLAAFASLSLSAHRGIHSLGLLLSISILCLVYCTIVVLPAMILVRDRRRR